MPIPFRIPLLAALLTVTAVTGAPHRICAQDAPPPLSLSETVAAALAADLAVKSAGAGQEAARAARDGQKTQFLPSFSTGYRYTRFYEKKDISFFGVTIPTRAKHEYAWSASVTQPLFTGFALLNSYRISELGLDLATVNKSLTRQNVILEAKKAYFNVLRAEKLVSVAQEAVTLLEAFGKVARDFHEVGMSPQNEVLKADVELANTRQELTAAQNALDLARSGFNTLLRRPMGAPVRLVDVRDHTPLDRSFDQCLAEALANRQEIAAADLEVDIGERELALSRKDYYPTVNLQGNLYQLGADPDLKGDEGISDASSWEVMVAARWDFWQWGRTQHGVREKTGRLNQARYRRQDLEDRIRLDVQQAFLRAREAEENIETVRTAIEQARENYRISEERYKEHMATSTDVLDARTLLSRTLTNYYGALYDFNIAKATLDRAVGRETAE